MNHYALAAILTFWTSLILSLITIYKGKREPVNMAFVKLSLAAAGYGFSFYKICTASATGPAFFWGKITMFVTLFIPIFYLQLSLLALDRPLNRKTMTVIYGAAMLYGILNFSTDLILKPPRSIPGLEYMNSAGILYGAAVLVFIGIVLYTEYRLIWGIKHSTGVKRNQLKYLLIGPAVGLAGGASNFITAYDINIYPLNPFGGYAAPLYPVIIAYAIIRYKLLDISFVIRKIIAGAWIIFLATVAIIGIHSLPLPPTGRIFLCITAAAVLALFAPKIIPGAERIVNNILYREKYKYQEKLDSFTETIILIPNEENLLKETAKKAAETIGTETAAVFTPDIVENNYLLRTQIGLDKLKDDFRIQHDGLIEWLKKRRAVFLKEEQEKALHQEKFAPIREVLEKLQASVCVPALLKNDLLGIITLGEKSSGEMYSHIDTRILHRLGTQLAIALDYKRLEGELRKRQEYAAIGKMGRELSHEMKNLMVAPKMFMDLLPEKMDDPSFMGDFRQLAVKDIGAINRKIEDLLYFSQGITPIFMPHVDINKIIRDVIKEIQMEEKGKKIEIKEELNDLPKMIADNRMLGYMVKNLLNNALDTMKDREGKVRVRSRIHHTLSGKMHEVSSRWIRIEVKDDGKGIAPEMQEKLFSPFETSKSGGGNLQSHGFGLGLPVVKMIVDAHRGIIGVNSELDKGTTFVVDLPVEQKMPTDLG